MNGTQQLGLLIQTFLDSNSSESLNELQQALAGSMEQQHDTASLLLECTSPQVKTVLLSRLAACLNTAAATTVDKLNASRILINLATSSEWCASMVEQHVVLPEIVRALSSCVAVVAQSSAWSADVDVITLAEQISWAIGNVCSDSSEARMQAMDSGALEALIRAFNLTHHALTSNAAQQTEVFMGFCRNSVWALSNLARGHETSALPFLCASTSSSIYGYTDAGKRGDDTFLRRESLMAVLLMKNQHHIHEAKAVDELKQEVCWLLAYLTAKEDEAVHKLCLNSVDNRLCNALVSHLEYTWNAALEQKVSGTVSNDAILTLAARSLPIIRTIGNISTACDGYFVSPFLSAGGTAGVSGHNLSLLPDIIAKLILLPLESGMLPERSALACESAWVAGALLVDAGVVDNTGKEHPSNFASVVLCPALCRVLSSHSTKLELKREAAFALWNTVAKSPGANYGGGNDMQRTNMILRDIASFDGLIPCLCRTLLTAADADANLAALMLISSMLTRLQADAAWHELLQRKLSEEGIVDSLDQVCDRASSSYYSSKGGDSMEQAANIAADLIDDFFAEEILFDDIDDDQNNIHASQSFTFQVPPVSAGGFNFGCHHGGPSATVQGVDQGRGRGRGKALPAWMQQQQQR
eukprot:CAMPEP_0196808902 /NCGR_PEP_ID=MMETSP1362-20130617/8894_1 /TAXON_ID=163516 /ORGANISM="Leptocylindrus danicus, Strain CCMP1856" /LENGTH=641 /DNA_ID=CAMNT_0042183411 /DNA_START=202 /DNA_END=2127 /DNA_ORIENTATION=+